jgi:hypothetical protein
VIGDISQYSNVRAFGNVFLFWIAVACMLLPIMVLLVRPAAWKQSPIVVACLGAVAILFLLAHQPDGFSLFDPIFHSFIENAPLVLFEQVATGIYMLPYVAFIPGLLLLSQCDRVRSKQAQSVQSPQPALMPVGQRLA